MSEKKMKVLIGNTECILTLKWSELYSSLDVRLGSEFVGTIESVKELEEGV